MVCATVLSRQMDGTAFRQHTYMDFVAAVDSAVYFSVVENSQHEGARDVRVGTFCPACHVAVHSSVLYRHSQRLDTHYLTCDTRTAHYRSRSLAKRRQR